MRYALLISTLLFWLLTGCAPGADHDKSAGPAFEHGTGFHATNSAPYTDGGDPRVAPATKKLAPLNPEKPTPAEKKRLLFSQSLKDFKLLRYDDAEKKPRRFGKARFEFEVALKNDVVIAFKGPLKTTGASIHFTGVPGSNPSYRVDGDITDGEEVSVGRFTLHYGQQQATVFFRAYRAKLHLRRDNAQDLSITPDLLTIVDDLSTNTYAWVSNFIVPIGVSRYQNDILKYVEPGKPLPLTAAVLSFSGDSVETGSLEAPVSKVVAGAHVKSVHLEGDSYHDNRNFSVRLHDDKGHTTQVMLDIDRDVPAAPEPLRPPPDERASTEDIDEIDIDPQPIDKHESVTSRPPAKRVATPVLPPVKPVPAKSAPQNPPQAPPAPAPVPVAEGKQGLGPHSYFATDYTNPRLTRTHRIIDDWEKNFIVPDVTTWIHKWSRPSASPLKNFYKYAFPFVGYIQSIAATYDVPPGFAFLVVVESMKYLNGHYNLEAGDGSSAWGPFQIIYKTAISVGMRVLKNFPSGDPGKADERSYFVTSACGAANLLHQTTEPFLNGDTTLGIMGYNQGAGAASAVAKVKHYGVRYSYDFATIARDHMANKDWIRYVAQVLAAYFISGNPADFNMNDVHSEMPENGVPSFEARDPRCQAVINQLRKRI